MLDLSGFFRAYSSQFWASDDHWELLQDLPDGHQGTIATLQVMRWFCRRDCDSAFTTAITKRLLESRPKPTPVVETLFLFARDCITFREDTGPNGEDDIERIADFERTTRLGYGDCDDKVIWLGTGLLNRGISCRFRVQSYGETWDHVYLEFWSWPLWRWVSLDPTADGHGNSPIAEIGWRQKLPVTGREMIYPI